MVQAFKDEKLIVIFASGISLAQKLNSPIVPMHITGSNSLFYYSFWFLNTKIKDMTLFRELLKKVCAKYQMQIGKPIVSTTSPESLTSKVRKHVVSGLKKRIEDLDS